MACAQAWKYGAQYYRTCSSVEPAIARARIFKTRWFERFVRKEKIPDSVLVDAVARAEKGLVDADLGGGVVKQRIARAGQGESGGYRTIIFSVGESVRYSLTVQVTYEKEISK